MEVAAMMWQEFVINWPKYLSIPVISAVIGWATNSIAIWMAFNPRNFIGIPPYLGWQGVVVRLAPKFAKLAVHTMVDKMLDLKELFSKFEAHRITKELEPFMMNIIEEFMNDLMTEEIPAAWEALPIGIKRQIYKLVKKEMPNVIKEMMEDVQANIEDVFDVKTMLIETLLNDLDILCDIFRRSAKKEMEFIRFSGVYFGVPLGIIQIFFMLYYQAWWVLPVFGAICGYITNVLAIKMIFEPKRPIKIGPITLYGLFFKRKNEIAAEQGIMIANEIMTPDRVIAGILKGPSSDRLFKLIHRQVQRAFDEQAGIAKPFVLMTVGTKRYIKVKEKAIEKMIFEMPRHTKLIEAYAYEALDVENYVKRKVNELPAEDFEKMIRPIFEEDEWIMTLAGGVLGLIVGFLQVFLLFNF
ncbi:MAG: DUF445 family protein [Desulfobacterales bacterium]|nr:DUF445 family protein [Desulfobacterales bacterium]